MVAILIATVGIKSDSLKFAAPLSAFDWPCVGSAESCRLQILVLIGTSDGKFA